MTKAELVEILSDIPDDTEIVIENEAFAYESICPRNLLYIHIVEGDVPVLDKLAICVHKIPVE